MNELVTVSLLDVVKVDKDQQLIYEGLITDLNDTKKYWSSKRNITSKI